ncbi:MAG: nucleotidyltransferase domain-containing protein [Armatimonadota bacterium]|nr:nucleotidyltransferase domain-containing protein [Armatimonadota bacterium]
MAVEPARVNELIDKAIAFLGEHIRVSAVFLFGSHLTGDADEWSDIDIAVFSPEIEDMRLMARVRLATDLRLSQGLELEPHFFPEWALHDPPEGSFAEHVIKTGKRIV